MAWESVEGRQVGKFLFESLPAGRYELSVEDEGWFQWDPKRVEVSPPAEGSRFVARDDQAQAEFAFRVRDSDGGEKLPKFQASIQVVGDSPKWKWRDFAVPVLSRFPLDWRFRWRVDLEGYAPALGDEKSFSVEETRDGRIWKFAEVDLRRGWGEVFRVVAKARDKPIRGALVRLDGRDAGTTGADGTVVVFAAERPRDVEFVYRDWKPTEPVDLRPVAWRREKRFVLVKLVQPSGR